MELFPYVDLKNQLARKLDADAVGAPGGVAGLDDNGRVTFAQLPMTLAELTSAVEYTQNKGKPGGYASLGGNGTVPPSQLPASFLPKFASVEQAADPEITDRIISPMTMHEVVGAETMELSAKIEDIRARVPDWEVGKTYPVDSVVQRGDILWRAKETTDVPPGPPTLEVNANDTSFWTNTTAGGGVEDADTAVIGDQQAYYSILLDKTLLDGMRVSFDLAYYKPGHGQASYTHIGLHWGGSSLGWTKGNSFGVTGDDVLNTGAGFAHYEMHFYRTGLGLAVDLYTNGALTKTNTLTSPTDFLDARFRSKTYTGYPKFKNFVFQYGGASPEWEILSHVGAARYFRDLQGIPSGFPPASHGHSGADITSGTVAEARLPSASESAKGIEERATLAETATGTDNTRFTTPAGVKQEIDKAKTAVAPKPWTPGAYAAGAQVDHLGYCWMARVPTSAEPEVPAIGTPTLVYDVPFVAAGYNGLINAIGTVGGTEPYSNPITSGKIVGSQTNVNAGQGPANAFNHSGAIAAVTSNVAGSWWMIDLGVGRAIVLDQFGVQGRDEESALPKNYKIRGSNDGVSWVDLITVVGTAIPRNAWWVGECSDTTKYRYFQFINTGPTSSGDHYLVLGEVELWGTYYEMPLLQDWQRRYELID